MIPLALVFPDFQTALQVARVLSGVPDVEELPSDGYLYDEEAGTNTYFNIAAYGVLHGPVWQTDENGEIVLETVMTTRYNPETDRDEEVPEYHPVQAVDENGTPLTAPILSSHTNEPGYCVIGLWHGPEETIPDGLRQFMVPPEELPVRYG